jgi:hypothetical protein
MLAAIAERLSALAPHFARRPQLRFVHQLQAIEAQEGLKGVAQYACHHADGDTKALAALQCASDRQVAIKRLGHWVNATSKPDPKPREVKRLLRLFHRASDDMLKRNEE